VKVYIIIFSISVWIVFCSILPQNEIKGVFAVKVGLQGTGKLYTLHAFINNGRTLTHQKILSNEEFIRFASGFWPSIYNPKRIDYFKSNQINCGITTDVSNITTYSYCLPLDSIWKIKYLYFPFSNNPETGWANGSYGPSEGQFIYLKERYKIDNLENSYITDKYLWLFLSDLQKNEWIKTYKSIH
jgi:hypothetical protein